MLNIIINTKFSAIHSWPDCPIEEVNYLIYPHRHEFHVQVKAPVNHENRDIEFIQLKNQLQKWIAENWDQKYLKGKSCEHLCTDLLSFFPFLTYIRIMEDGENGSELIVK